MTNNKTQKTPATVAEKPIAEKPVTEKVTPAKALSPQHQTAVDSAKVKTKNDGSHIAKQRQKLIDNTTNKKDAN